MNYIYDILLNFTNNYYYDFYEWNKNDSIINIKKIPLIYVNTKVLYDFINYKIKVDKSFIELLKDKTMTYKKYNNKYEYSIIISNKDKALGMCFDKDGNLIYKSSLLLDEEDECNRIINSDKEYIIKYKKLDFNNNSLTLRGDIEKKKNILKEIKKIYDKKEYDKLRYIYYDLFNKESNDLEYMYSSIIDFFNNYIGDYNLVLETIKK